MRTLILYKSKYGFTEKIANLIKEHRQEADIIELSDFEYDFTPYQEVIIGTPIYMGQINKRIKKVFNSYENELLNKTLKVFLCGMAFKQENTVIDQNFNTSIIKHAKIKYVGGAYQFEKMNFIYKVIVKKISGSSENKETILHEKIEELLK